MVVLTSDRLLFTFTLIDAAKPDREFCFVLEMKDECSVPLCDPPIATAELVAQFNADRDFGAFTRRGELNGLVRS